MSTAPTTTPPDDKELSATELQAKYSTGESWGKHPTFPPEDWQYQVGEGDTRLGYWEWVASEIASADDADEDGDDEDGGDSNEAPV
jgi:hypothetical protein